MLTPTYQPHLLEVPKDDIYAAVAALTKSKEYALSFATQVQNGTAKPLVGIGKMILEQVQKDIKLIEDALTRFKFPYKEAQPSSITVTQRGENPITISSIPAFGKPSNPRNVSTLPSSRVKQESGLHDDFLSKRQAKRLARVPNPNQQFWTCRICLRSKFTRPGQPHKCHGGSRKRFKRYARLKGWDSCFIETPKITSSRSHCVTGSYVIMPSKTHGGRIYPYPSPGVSARHQA